MKSRDSKPPKKPYHRPHLLVYGDVRTVTQALGLKAQFDNIAMTTMSKS
jgi:hypothetical protein